MNDDANLNALLDDAVQAVHAEPLPAELTQRCLTKARAVENVKPSLRGPRISRRNLTWRVAAGMAVAACLAVWVSTWVVEPPLAMAQIRAALENVKSLHVKSASDGENFTIDLYYRQDTGYKYVSPDWVLLDDGEHRYEYDVPNKTATQYLSRFQKKEYVSLESLGMALGFSLADAPGEEFQRTPELDKSLDGQLLQAYAWQADLGDTTHRYVWHVDEKMIPVMYQNQFRPSPLAEWEIRNTIQISFADVPAEKIAANFPDDVKLVEQANPVKEIDGKMFEESVIQAAQAIHAHWPDYYGWQFEIEIDVNRRYGPDVDVASQNNLRQYSDADVHYRDVFAILPPRKEGERPRRFWKRYAKDDQGNDLLLAACAFDGDVTRRYSHRPMEEDLGLIVAWEDMSPLDDMPNYFDKILFLRLCLIEDFPRVPENLELYGLETMHLANSHRHDGRTDLTFTWPRQGSGELCQMEVEVAGDPCWRIRNYQIHLTNSEGKKLLEQVTLEDLAKFDGGWYPASGRYLAQGYKLLDELNYRFQVTQVTRLPEDAEDHWWIEWPNGTFVRDQVKWENRKVPGPPIKVEPPKQLP